jgi:hypothetical protein
VSAPAANLTPARRRDSCSDRAFISVVLKPLRRRIPGGRPAWAVLLDGQTIIPRAHDPEHEAARWLRDHGHSGPMQTAREDGTVSMRYRDLVRTAEWSLADRAAGGFLRRRYCPWSSQSPAGVHTSPAGRPEAPSLGPDTDPLPFARVRRDVITTTGPLPQHLGWRSTATLKFRLPGSSR